MASELNLKSVKTNLEEIKGLSRRELRESVVRKPIRPNALLDGHMKINLDMKNMDADLIENEIDIKYPGADLCRSRGEDGTSFQRDANTPSQTTSHRKSIEKWIYPDAQKVGKKKIDMARAILIDNNEKSVKKQSAQDVRLKNLNDSKSIRSDRSIEDPEAAVNQKRVFGGQDRLGWLSNKSLSGSGLHLNHGNKEAIPAERPKIDQYQDEVILENNFNHQNQDDEILIENRNDYDGSHWQNEAADEPQPEIRDQLEPVFVPQSKKHHKNLLEEAHEMYNEPIIFEKQNHRDYPYNDEQAEDSAKSIVDSPAIKSRSEDGSPEAENQRMATELNFSPTSDIYQGLSSDSKAAKESFLKSYQDGGMTQENHYGLDNKEISSLTDLIDPNVMPQFDNKHVSVVQQVAMAERRHEELDQSADEVANDILGMLFDELLTDGFVLRAMFKLQPDLPKGIKTNINCVKGYLSNLTEYIVSSFEFIAAHFIEGIKYQLNSPLGPTPEERLRLFHAIGDEENMDSSYAKINYEQVLDIDIYFRFEDEVMVGFGSHRNKRKIRKSNRKTSKQRWSTSTTNFYLIASTKLWTVTEYLGSKECRYRSRTMGESSR